MTTQKNIKHESPQEFGMDNHITPFSMKKNTLIQPACIRDKWFQSTLVKLMFYGEPTTSSAAQTQTGLMFAQELEGDQASGKKPRVDDNGNLWTTHIPDNGAYNFKVFKPAYFSSNRLVKLYKIDYSTIDSSFEIKNDFVGTDGSAMRRSRTPESRTSLSMMSKLTIKA